MTRGRAHQVEHLPAEIEVERRGKRRKGSQRSGARGGEGRDDEDEEERHAEQQRWRAHGGQLSRNVS